MDPGGLPSAFAPPSESPALPSSSRAGLAFVVRRFVRLLVGPPVLAACTVPLLGRVDWVAIGVCLALGAAMWAIPTGLLYRVHFFPRPPDPRVYDEVGPRAAADLRTQRRVQLWEHVGSSGAPILLLLLWVPQQLTLPAPLVWTIVLCFTAVLGIRNVQAMVQGCLTEAQLDLALGDVAGAIRRLTSLDRIPWFSNRDEVHLLRARAAFREGDRAAAMAALDRVKDRAGWQVGLQRAQMTVGSGTSELRTEIEPLRSRPEFASMVVFLDVLADLHDGRLEQVRDRTEQVFAVEEYELHRLGCLLVASAWAGTDPENARQVLARTGWDASAVRVLAAVWPALAPAVDLLDGG